jgi:hypothetical protein
LIAGGFNKKNILPIVEIIKANPKCHKIFYSLYSGAKSGAIQVDLQTMYYMEQVHNVALGGKLEKGWDEVLGESTKPSHKHVEAGALFTALMNFKNAEQDITAFIRNAELEHQNKINKGIEQSRPGILGAAAHAFADAAHAALNPFKDHIAEAAGVAAGAANAAANVVARHSLSGGQLGLLATGTVLVGYGKEIWYGASTALHAVKVGAQMAIYPGKKLVQACASLMSKVDKEAEALKQNEQQPEVRGA